MDIVAPVGTMKEEPNEMECNNDIGSLEFVGIPGCIKVKMEEPDIENDVPEKVVVEKTGTNKGKIVIKDEDGAILGDNFVDGNVDQTNKDTAAVTTDAVGTTQMECSDDDLFEEAEIDINLQETNSVAIEMPDSIDISEHFLLRAIKQEESITSEKGDSSEDNTNLEARNLDFELRQSYTSESEDDSTSEEANDRHLKSHKKRLSDDMLTCGECDYQTKNIWHLRTHKLRHKSETEIEMFGCGECDFRTKYKGALKRHERRHKKSTVIQMNLEDLPSLSCGQCDYQTKNKYHLKTHQLRHTSVTEVQMFSCGDCDYRTKYKGALKRHELQHKESSEVEVFSCGECNYQTKYKQHLRIHTLRHQDIAEIKRECDDQAKDKSDLECSKHDLTTKYDSYLKILKQQCKSVVLSCSQCGYQTKYKHALKRHELQHKQSSEIEFYSCGECDYRAKHKQYLKMHKLRHRSATEIEMFHCGECNYQAKVKADLVAHTMRHRTATESEMLQCGKCDFRTKHKNSLKAHELRHGREVMIHHCRFCPYQTKFKNVLKSHEKHHRSNSKHPANSAATDTIEQSIKKESIKEESIS